MSSIVALDAYEVTSLLRGPDIAGLEVDLAKVQHHLRRAEADAIFSPAERELEESYYAHWQKRLERALAGERALTMQPTSRADDSPKAVPNKVTTSDESWRVITPPTLMRAVTKIRDDCKLLFDAVRHHFSDKCFKELHSLAPGLIEPAIFKNGFDDCIDKSREIVKHTFTRFLDISLNQSGLIGKASVHWASLQLVDLIEREDKHIDRWIKSACDGPSNCYPKDSHEFMEKVVFRTDWRAPAWLVMQPNGNVIYNASTAWERMNETATKDILRYLREGRWIILLNWALEQLVGTSHEVLAKRKPLSGGNPPSRNPENVTGTPETTARAGSTQALLLKYRSGIKRAILLALTKNPMATDAEVCRSLDADGGEELPSGWKVRKDDRSFYLAYGNPKTKRKIEIAISKIRRDLRDRGLLD